MTTETLTKNKAPGVRSEVAGVETVGDSPIISAAKLTKVYDTGRSVEVRVTT